MNSSITIPVLVHLSTVMHILTWWWEVPTSLTEPVHRRFKFITAMMHYKKLYLATPISIDREQVYWKNGRTKICWNYSHVDLYYCERYVTSRPFCLVLSKRHRPHQSFQTSFSLKCDERRFHLLWILLRDYSQEIRDVIPVLLGRSEVPLPNFTIQCTISIPHLITIIITIITAMKNLSFPLVSNRSV